MSKVLILFCTYFFLPYCLLSQSIEYYDKDWNPCPREVADFYREITYDENGKPAGMVKDYFITGELQFEGAFLSVNPDTLDGVCTWYYRNGQRAQEISYDKGKKVGNIREWSINGKEEGVLDKSGLFFSDEYLQAQLDEISKPHTKFGIDSFTIEKFEEAGFSLMRKGDFEASFLLMYLIHDISIHLKDEKKRAISYNNIGRIYKKQGQLKEALKWYLKAQDIEERQGFEVGLARSCNNIGAIYRSFGKLDEALKWYVRSKEIRKRLKLMDGLSKTYNNIGIVYAQRGQWNIALESYNKSKDIKEQLGLIESLPTSYNNIGIIFSDQGKWEEALDSYHEAKKIEIDLGDYPGLATTCNNIGSTYYKKGQLDEALKWHFTAIEIQKEINSVIGLATSYNNIGGVYMSRKQWKEALEWLNKALEILEPLEYKARLAVTYSNVGNIHYQLRQFDKALNWYHKAIDIEKQLKLNVHLAKAYSNVGMVYTAQKQWEKALEWHHKARKIKEQFGLKVSLTNTYNNIGGIYNAQKKWSAALKWYNKAKDIKEELNLELELSFSYHNLGVLFYQSQQLDSALHYAIKNINLNEKLREENQGVFSRELYIDNSITAIETSISSAFYLQDPKIAFTISEKNKARGLSDLLTEQSIDNKIIPKYLKASFLSINAQLSAVNQNLSIDIPNIKRKNLIKQRDSLLTKRQEMEDQIKVIAPEYANLIYPETVDRNQVQSILQNDEVLISFSEGVGTTFASLLTPSRHIMIDLGPSDSLQVLVDQFRNEFIQGQKKALTKNDIFLRKQLKHDFFQGASQLYQKLWAPLEAMGLLEDKKIIIVPDGFLHYLPFELLVKDKEQKQYTEYQYLIKEYPISYYPSATVLHFERTREREAPRDQKEFFGLAVENFENNYCYESKQHFPSLSYASQEIKSIANCFAPDQRYILFDHAASEEQLKAIDLRQFRYLHFSTHGLINAEKPDFSRLLLQPSDSQDGCLDLYEIFDLKLHADLVTLSACETGLGQLVRGEGMVGFTRALMYAGTPSVMLSLWEVADASTAELFANYYAQLQQSGGTDKYQALRNTQLKMIKSEQYANPYYWAPFVFIGATN